MKTLMEQFRDFADKKNPNENYFYKSAISCACGQFTRSIGLYDDYINYLNFDLHNFETFDKLEQLAAKEPHEWGKLVERIDNELERPTPKRRASKELIPGVICYYNPPPRIRGVEINTILIDEIYEIEPETKEPENV